MRVPGVLAAAALSVHPLHTTLTQLTYDTGDRTVEISVRAFANDFRAAVGPDTSAAAAFAYLGKVLTLSDRQGRALDLSWCGVRRTGDLVWLCLRSLRTRPTDGLRGLRVEARMLFDLYPDQINIVQANSEGRWSSLLFARGDPPKSLP